MNTELILCPNLLCPLCFLRNRLFYITFRKKQMLMLCSDHACLKILRCHFWCATRLFLGSSFVSAFSITLIESIYGRSLISSMIILGNFTIMFLSSRLSIVIVHEAFWGLLWRQPRSFSTVRPWPRLVRSKSTHTYTHTRAGTRNVRRSSLVDEKRRKDRFSVWADYLSVGC